MTEPLNLIASVTDDSRYRIITHVRYDSTHPLITNVTDVSMHPLITNLTDGSVEPYYQCDRCQYAYLLTNVTVCIA